MTQNGKTRFKIIKSIQITKKLEIKCHNDEQKDQKMGLKGYN